MEEGSNSRPTPSQPGTPRKPYRAPRLVRLGTLLELTALVGMNSSKSDTHGTKTQ
jgi:hypothetical protein